MAFRLNLVGRLALVALLALSVSACNRGLVRQAPGGKAGLSPVDQDPRANLYSKTVSAAKAGDCSTDNLSILTCFAARGRGFDGAQTLLGKCLISRGAEEKGAEWIAMAANADWADAQYEMAKLAQEGRGMPADPVAAAKWSFLYTQNPALMSLGVPVDKERHNKLLANLTPAQKDEARRQARDFSPTFRQPEVVLTAEAQKACRVRSIPVIDEVEFYNPDAT